MKTIILSAAFILVAFSVNAQDVIMLKSGTTINGKVAEVGINEIKYYKAENLQGPVYVTSKYDVVQITYANGVKDSFVSINTQQPSNVVVVPQQVPQTVIVERQYSRSRPYPYPIFIPHVNFGFGPHMNVGHYRGGHHGGRH